MFNTISSVCWVHLLNQIYLIFFYRCVTKYLSSAKYVAINYSILEIRGNSPFIFCEHISAKLILKKKSNSYEWNSSFWQKVPLQPWITPLMQKLWGGCSKANELMHNYFFLKHYSLGSPVIAFSSSLRRECPHQKEWLFRLVLSFPFESYEGRCSGSLWGLFSW